MLAQEDSAIIMPQGDAIEAVVVGPNNNNNNNSIKNRLKKRKQQKGLAHWLAKRSSRKNITNTTETGHLPGHSKNTITNTPEKQQKNSSTSTTSHRPRTGISDISFLVEKDQKQVKFVDVDSLPDSNEKQKKSHAVLVKENIPRRLSLPRELRREIVFFDIRTLSPVEKQMSASCKHKKAFLMAAVSTMVVCTAVAMAYAIQPTKKH